jgi:branched-chain amino acid transport system substrate-binding protein
MSSQSMYRGEIVAAAAVLGLCSTTAFARQEPCIGSSAAVTNPSALGDQAIKMTAEMAGERGR